jgi:hypothetical protein
MEEASKETSEIHRPRRRVSAAQDRLIQDYFTDPYVYPSHCFCRRCRLWRSLFFHILEMLGAHFTYFTL